MYEQVLTVNTRIDMPSKSNEWQFLSTWHKCYINNYNQYVHNDLISKCFILESASCDPGVLP